MALSFPMRTNKKTQMLQFEKEDNWGTPEGILPAFYRETRVVEKMIGGKLETVIRPVFQLTSMPSSRYNYVVSKNYRLSEPHKLKADLQNWLGDNFFDLLDENGVLTKEALDSLIGKKADLQVVQIANDGHKSPFSHLVAIAPPGTLTNLN